MTIVTDIIASHATTKAFSVGDLVNVTIDRIYLQDGNTPTIARLFQEHKLRMSFPPSHVGVFFDHSVIVPNQKVANRLREARSFAEKMELTIFPSGAGISHIVALESGWFEPGGIVLGSDSHTCTGGAMQCLALGMGASDVAAAMVTGETWVRVPETLQIVVLGEPRPYVSAKDVILYLLATYGQEPFLYKSIEWMGVWPSLISLDSAVTLSSMAVDMGAKCAFLPPGPGRARNRGESSSLEANDSQRIHLEAMDLSPMVARPHSATNSVPIDDCHGEKIDYVFVGSCTNSSLEDLAKFASVLTNATVHRDVYCLVTPGSKDIYLKALHKGYIDTLIRAGAIVTPPGCSACLGTQGSIPASGERVLSTMNRNFLGRMGNAESEIFLASPLVAGYTAIKGEIPCEDDLS